MLSDDKIIRTDLVDSSVQLGVCGHDGKGFATASEVSTQSLSKSTRTVTAVFPRWLSVRKGALPGTSCASSSPAPAPSAESAPAAPLPWSPLVTLRAGAPQRVPLFCVHGAGGHVLNFRPLADRLDPGQPVYGLQAQGVDGRLAPLPSVEAMASQYVQALRAVAPQGPYRFAGYSGGGLIALAMAQQLQDAGERVDLLAMIDTLAPGAARAPLSLWRKLWLARRWRWGQARGWWHRRQQARHARARVAEARARLARGEPLTPELVEEHLFSHFLSLQAHHAPRPYAGRLWLFTAREADLRQLAAGPRLGWEAHVRGPIEVVPLPGAHLEVMTGAGLEVLAEGLRRAFAEADAQARVAAGGDSPGAAGAAAFGVPSGA